MDVSVPDAESLKEFYAELLGLRLEPTDMGGYNDWSLVDDQGPVGGVCHAKGVNAKVPPMWLPYFSVPNLADAIALATGRGATLLDDRSEAGFAIIQDPAGACFALFCPPPQPA